MRILWLCNKCIPAVAKKRGIETGNKEGWLAGISERVLSEKAQEIEFGVCFPVAAESEEFSEHYPGVWAYGFYENPKHPEVYEKTLEEKMKGILLDFHPDIVHIFGTEYPHTLAMVRAFGKPEQILIGIQGLCSLYAKGYLEGIPAKIVKKATFRDCLKKDSIIEQQRKFVRRGEYEIEAIRGSKNITGRTKWDEMATNMFHADARYYPMNETLRSNFYHSDWDYAACKKHSIFVSQGDYPIKGFHYMLRALPLIREKYPDVTVSVAGNDIVGFHNLKKSILISEYGKYLKELIQKNDLSGIVTFCGSLSADKMKEQFLKSHVFVLCSVLENSPNALGEAMLLGMPCVASLVGGVESMISRQEGYCYSDSSPEKLAESVIRAFEETDLAKGRTKREENARQRAQKTHDPDTNYNRLMEIYDEIYKRNRKETGFMK
ncbi:MAG: glycosyltransferase family 4 protein [Lachnospiraceae bacterium]|nr:glycosyltransferase family 4 protein [Lachnospiraceae bacterium]